MKERKTEEKSGRVIFSALPTPVLRFHEDKKKLNQRHVLNFDLAELNSHKKKIFKSYTQATNKSSVIVFTIILLDSISDGSGTQNRILVHLESPTK